MFEKKIKRRVMFHVMWRLCEIQISLSMNKVLCNTATFICSDIIYGYFCVTAAKMSHCRDHMSFIESLLTAYPDNTNLGSGFVVSILFYWISHGFHDHFQLRRTTITGMETDCNGALTLLPKQPLSSLFFSMPHFYPFSSF